MKKSKVSKQLLQIMIVGIALMIGGAQVKAQSRDSEQEDVQQDDQEHFFFFFYQENFKSDFGNDQRDRNVDYSREDRRGRENNYDIFGNDKEQNYKFDEIQTDQKSGANSNGGSIMIQGPQGGNDINPRENVNMPSVSDPFKQGQTGVKAPRNIDAVPDNGDEPNDVPIDGGISVLALAAAAFGLKRYRK